MFYILGAVEEQGGIVSLCRWLGVYDFNFLE
jgi:hypothetical protein